MRKAILIFPFLLILLLSACAGDDSSTAGKKMQDGYYTAEAEGYHHGWKEFVTIFVRDGEILSIEYNARNASGFIKSWDMDYMRTMNKVAGNYPNRYTRDYGSQLLSSQDYGDIDCASGATSSYSTFTLLAEAVINCAYNGDTAVAIVSAE